MKSSQKNSEIAVRVVLLNSRDQVLLQKISIADRPEFYITPGGRLEAPEEPLVAAVRRELKEETGFDSVVFVSDKPFFSGTHVMQRGTSTVEMTEHFFVVRLQATDVIEPDKQRLSADEQKVFVEQEWFDASEIATRKVFPINLASIVKAIVCGNSIPAVDFSDH